MLQETYLQKRHDLFLSEYLRYSWRDTLKATSWLPNLSFSNSCCDEFAAEKMVEGTASFSFDGVDDGDVTCGSSIEHPDISASSTRKGATVKREDFRIGSPILFDPFMLACVITDLV